MLPRCIQKCRRLPLCGVNNTAPIRSASLRQTGRPSGVSERRWRFISSGTLSLSRKKVVSRMRRSASTYRNLLSVSKSISWKRNNQQLFDRLPRYEKRSFGGSAFPSATWERGKKPRGQWGCDSKCPLDSLGERSNDLLTQTVWAYSSIPDPCPTKDI